MLAERGLVEEVVQYWHSLVYKWVNQASAEAAVVHGVSCIVQPARYRDCVFRHSCMRERINLGRLLWFCLTLPNWVATVHQSVICLTQLLLKEEQKACKSSSPWGW